MPVEHRVQIPIYHAMDLGPPETHAVIKPQWPRCGGQLPNAARRIENVVDILVLDRD
jgi:hypothetical protein